MDKKRTFNTLYSLISVDGKISSGLTDNLDFDKDFPKIKGIKEGLQQYYDIEKTTDIVSLTSGRVWEKLNINKKQNKAQLIPVSFIVIDNKPHLTIVGINNILARCKKMYLVTNNDKHPANKIKGDKLIIIKYTKKINFQNLFTKLKKDFGVKRITIQSGGELNAVMIRQGLIDKISIVIAPALVGGRNTSTLMDGDSLKKLNELKLIKALKLEKVAKLKNSYIHLKYTVK